VKILEDHLVPYAWTRFGPTEENPVPFVHDRSPIHTSYLVQDWFEEEGKEFDVIPWPPKGADLNPIENVWAEMVTSMDSQHVATEIELRENVTEIWRQLGRRQNYWQTLCNSMDNRLQLVIEVDGDWTKY
jgi:hypothetical protein